MLTNLSRRSLIILWQICFLLLGTTWLWAPYLNGGLSPRISLISDYETAMQPYSWLFRLGDAFAAVMLALFAVGILRRQHKLLGLLLLLASVSLLADPILITSCQQVGNVCRQHVTTEFILHSLETIVTSIVFLVLAVYDVLKRGKLASIGFSAVQVIFIALVAVQVTGSDTYLSIAQYIYETTVIVWVTWYCRDRVAPANYRTSKQERRIVKNIVAGWAFFNGVAAIILSLAHINLLGHIRGVYFASDTGWLAQHGIIVGVIMLYLSRHLARGEARARQIFLLLSGIEALKYAVVSPNGSLLLFYVVTFIGLFVLRDNFDRGTATGSWHVRLRDQVYLIAGLFIASTVALLLLDSDSRLAIITSHAVRHLPAYALLDTPFPKHEIRSVLLAQSISVFIISSITAMLWALFRPFRVPIFERNTPAARITLERYSNSSEDYFKLWPDDKTYFWNGDGTGFVAYKRVGSYACALADPIGPHRAELVTSFTAWAREHRLKVCYLPVFPRSLPLYQDADLNYVQIGASAIVDIKHFLEVTSKDKWWRWRLNKSAKSEYTYLRSTSPHSPKLIRELRHLSNKWLLEKGRQEYSFALGYFNAGYLEQCVIHYLTDKSGSVVAFTNQIPVFGDKTILAIDLLRSLPGSDSMAFLLYHILLNSRSQYNTLDLGFVPFTVSERSLLSIARILTAKMFSSAGLEQFKRKFDPEWAPNYVAYDGDIADLPTIAIAIEQAMAHKP